MDACESLNAETLARMLEWCDLGLDPGLARICQASATLHSLVFTYIRYPATERFPAPSNAWTPSV